MEKLYRSLYINNRFFYSLAAITLLFVIGFFIPVFFEISKVLLFSIVLLTIADAILLYTEKNGVDIDRKLPERLSNGDDNKIVINLKNNYKFSTYSSLIEELPYQFQKRDFVFRQQLRPHEEKTIYYNLKPKERGVYSFGNTNVYVSSPLRFATRKYVLSEPLELKCYPSFLRLKEFDISAFSSKVNTIGMKKVRRLGHSLEFEQIKEYITGDDIRTLNWKATAKRNQLMVNQYIEERSQPVYAVIDKGRVMQMSFDQLTLLDYAINATLAISNIVLRKQDKAGMLTFSNKIEDLIVAEQHYSQMNLISETLYNVKTDFADSDFSLLYASIKRKITQRSLLILFTNFETMDALHRQLPYLRALAKNHLLLVVFFKNTELEKVLNTKATGIQSVYDKVIAEKFMFEKRQIVNELRKYGIQSILTKPENLTGNTIQKYLALKARGLH